MPLYIGKEMEYVDGTKDEKGNYIPGYYREKKNGTETRVHYADPPIPRPAPVTNRPYHPMGTWKIPGAIGAYAQAPKRGEQVVGTGKPKGPAH